MNDVLYMHIIILLDINFDTWLKCWKYCTCFGYRKISII